MAAAFDLAGFSAIDVTMTDLLCCRENLLEFSGIAACGGFSFGDVLGAGLGWAKTILHQPSLRDLFASFFARKNTFALGVCNGCQMLAALKELIPGADVWPGFVSNRSEQFESRLVMVEIIDSKSILFSDMEGSRLPIVVAHGEGRARFERRADQDRLCQSHRVSMRYVDNYDRITDQYPANPNGSAGGVTAFCSQDGRVTIMMPHPERMVRTINCSWHPSDWGEFTPWLRIFQNARRFCD
jgi:phosphoribosylformylglycinamidine synthase